MPQYDPDPTILLDRAYNMAMELALLEWEDDEDEHPSDPRDLSKLIAYIRDTLLEEFPTIEADILATQMYDALYDIKFPTHRAD